VINIKYSVCWLSTYEGESKIFQTNAVKTIKHNTISKCRHHCRSGSLLHIHTGTTVFSIFGTLPGSLFLSECRALCDSVWISSVIPNRRPFSFSFIFENGKNYRVPNQGCTVGGGNDSHFVFGQKLLGENGSVRRGVVMVKQPGLFSPKFGASSHVFSELPQNVAVEPGIHSLACWDRCFALPQLMYRWRRQSGIFWITPRISKYCCIYRQ
jgi:hypothetical protein